MAHALTYWPWADPGFWIGGGHILTSGWSVVNMWPKTLYNVGRLGGAMAPWPPPGSAHAANLCKLNQSTYSWGTVQKSRSPKLPISLNNVPAYALLDSGAELNVLDAELAHKAGIKIIPTLVTAKAANKQTLDVQGQSAEKVNLSCTTEEGSKMLNLGFVLIVHGLGVSCIIGQPGIIDNNIIYLPKKKIIILAGEGSIHQVPWEKNAANHSIAHADVNITILPN